MKRSALFIGVNHYQDPEISNLEYAESDATELYALFKHKAGYDDVVSLLSPDSDELLDTACRMVSNLGKGDLFLLFFAGHGYVYDSKYLLLCSKAYYSRLEYLYHTVALEMLKNETYKSGLHRVFILDACRSNLLKGERGTANSGLRDVTAIKRIATVDESDTGSLAILCSCDEGQQSREIKDLRQGIFSRALMEELSESLSSGKIELDLLWTSWNLIFTIGWLLLPVIIGLHANSAHGYRKAVFCHRWSIRRKRCI